MGPVVSVSFLASRKAIGFWSLLEWWINDKQFHELELNWCESKKLIGLYACQESFFFPVLSEIRVALHRGKSELHSDQHSSPNENRTSGDSTSYALRSQFPNFSSAPPDHHKKKKSSGLTGLPNKSALTFVKYPRVPVCVVLPPFGAVQEEQYSSKSYAAGEWEAADKDIENKRNENSSTLRTLRGGRVAAQGVCAVSLLRGFGDQSRRSPEQTVLFLEQTLLWRWYQTTDLPRSLSSELPDDVTA